MPVGKLIPGPSAPVSLPSGAGWVCWMGLLGGFAGWVCWVGLPGGFAGWACWVGLPGGLAGLSCLHTAVPEAVGGQEIGSGTGFMPLPAKPSPGAGRELCKERRETRGGRKRGGFTEEDKEEATWRKTCCRLLRDRGRGPQGWGGKDRQRKIKCPRGACPSSRGGDAVLRGTRVPHAAHLGDGI